MSKLNLVHAYYRSRRLRPNFLSLFFAALILPKILRFLIGSKFWGLVKIDISHLCVRLQLRSEITPELKLVRNFFIGKITRCGVHPLFRLGKIVEKIMVNRWPQRTLRSSLVWRSRCINCLTLLKFFLIKLQLAFDVLHLRSRAHFKKVELRRDTLGPLLWHGYRSHLRIALAHVLNNPESPTRSRSYLRLWPPVELHIVNVRGLRFHRFPLLRWPPPHRIWPLNLALRLVYWRDVTVEFTLSFSENTLKNFTLAKCTHLSLKVGCVNPCSLDHTVSFSSLKSLVSVFWIAKIYRAVLGRWIFCVFGKGWFVLLLECLSLQKLSDFKRRH